MLEMWQGISVLQLLVFTRAVKLQARVWGLNVGGKIIRNIAKVFKSATGVLFGRSTAGIGPGEELSPSQVRTMLDALTSVEIAAAYQPVGTYATLVGGTIPTAQIPAIAITEYLGSVASEAAMLALDGDRGDWCNRSDLGTMWVLSADDSTLFASWTQLLYPTAPVTSVAGRTGAVTLSDTDISGLGTLATQSGTFSGTSSGTNTGDQNLFGTIAVSGQSSVVADAASDTLTVVAGTNISITTDAATDTITITNTASGLSGTGGVDNAVLRADGVGGATLQSSSFVMDDIYTASPNNTVNFVCVKPTGGTTNVGVAIVPKGTGAFSLSVPDGTATGGNARGANAVDLQTSRTAATHVASGSRSIVLAGENNTASGQYSIVGGFGSIGSTRTAVSLGYECTVNGSDGVALGMRNTAGVNAFACGRDNAASSTYAIAMGWNNTASGEMTVAIGTRSVASRPGEYSFGAGRFSSNGDAQYVRLLPRVLTTNATPTEILLNGTASTSRLTITSGKLFAFTARISGIKSDGTAAAHYVRKGTIKNVAGTTTLVGSIETIGTDVEDNAATDVAITANNTTDALQIDVTGIAAETWRWVAVVEGVEIGYGA